MSDRFSLNGTPKNLPAKATLAERDRVASAVLASRFDKLNELWTEAEKRLKTLKSPHDVWIEYGFDEHNQGEALGWRKDAKGNWRLFHAYVNAYDPMEEASWSGHEPLVECPVAVRVEAASELGKLHKAIITAKEDFGPKVADAIKELTEAVVEI